MKKIINGKILTPQRLPKGCGVLIDDGRILATSPESELPHDIETIDADGHWVIPGLIDIHIHGSAGSDTMEQDPASLAAIARFLLTRGVTAFLPTTVAASGDAIFRAIRNVETYHQSRGARLLGLHLEGPYLQGAYRGAQEAQFIRSAKPAEYQPWLESGVVKLMTVAPEVEGVMPLIVFGVSKGVKFAVGHSDANYDQVEEAVQRGLNQATHTFNAMRHLHHREPGVLGAVLTDERIFAQVIADGIPLHPAIVKLLFKAKGVDRTILITDAIQAAGAADGQHRLGTQTITVQDGIARTQSGALAGSTLFLNDGLINAARFTDSHWTELLPSATAVPAASLGLEDQVGSIKPGAYADLVIIDDHLSPVMTMVGGRIVYQRP